MFCSRCGAQIPDDSAFCYSCGAKSAPPAQPPPPPAPALDQPPPAPAPAAPPPAYSGQAGYAYPYAPQRPQGPMPARGGPDLAITTAGVIAGSMVFLGTFLDWLGLSGGLNAGFITDWDEGAGTDGIFTLLGAIGIAVLSVVRLYDLTAASSVIVLLLGIGVGAVAGVNMGKATHLVIDNYYDISVGDALSVAEEGLWFAGIGGALAFVTGLWGVIHRASSPPGYPVTSRIY